MGKEKAFGGRKVEDASQRCHASCRTKAVASSPAHVDISLEAL
jgi:hypothetical protein